MSTITEKRSESQVIHDLDELLFGEDHQSHMSGIPITITAQRYIDLNDMDKKLATLDLSIIRGTKFESKWKPIIWLDSLKEYIGSKISKPDNIYKRLTTEAELASVLSSISELSSITQRSITQPFDVSNEMFKHDQILRDKMIYNDRLINAGTISRLSRSAKGKTPKDPKSPFYTAMVSIEK
jgi:hypothetical protein